MSIDKALIGRRIQTERKKSGMTQKKLAEAVGLTDQYISKIERGDTAVTLQTISAIADALAVDISSLMSAANSGSPDYTKYDLFKIVDAATPAQRKKILAHAKIVVGK